MLLIICRGPGTLNGSNESIAGVCVCVCVCEGGGLRHFVFFVGFFLCQLGTYNVLHLFHKTPVGRGSRIQLRLR